MSIAEQIAVVGAGAWGTALADYLARRGYRVGLWAHEADVVYSINHFQENRRFLAGFPIAETVEATSDLRGLLASTTLIVIVIPTQHIRRVLEPVADQISETAAILCASKGIEAETLKTVPELLRSVLPDKCHRLALLSGPSFAKDLMHGRPTAVVAAAQDIQFAQEIQAAISSMSLRVYVTEDLAGVALGGSVKNVIAIAAGVSDGLGLGDSARSALITRGLAEMIRLGVKYDANPLTFSGLSGMGDLVLTCCGELSRNRQVGMRVGKGQPIDSILSGLEQAVEGVHTSQAIHALQERHQIELPICEGVFQVLFGGHDPVQAMHDLMRRDLRHERHGIDQF